MIPTATELVATVQSIYIPAKKRGSERKSCFEERGKSERVVQQWLYRSRKTYRPFPQCYHDSRGLDTCAVYDSGLLNAYM